MGRKWVDTQYPFMPLNSLMMELTLRLTFVGPFGIKGRAHRRCYIVSPSKPDPLYDEVIKNDAMAGAKFVLIEDPDATRLQDAVVGWWAYLQAGDEWVPVNWADIKGDVSLLVDSLTYSRINKYLERR